ncbi:MAG: transcriptional repressor [Desulfobacteraceae bacterium]
METKHTIRLTEQRKVILDVVRHNNTHPTVDEVYEQVRERLPRISLATVYRNLEVLAGMGIIQQLDPGRSQMRFDGNTRPHYHLTCMRCGRIEDVFDQVSASPIQNAEKALGKLTKYGIFGHKLEFIGLCSECLAKGCTFPEDTNINQGYSPRMEGEVQWKKK